MKTHQYFFAGMLSLACFCARAEFVVIVSAKAPVSQLTSEQASQIFLGKLATFPGGEQAIPLDLPDGTSIRNEFYEKLANKSPKQLMAYRANRAFSGKGMPPKEITSALELKKIVATNPNTVGYLEKSEVDGSVKVVLSP